MTITLTSVILSLVQGLTEFLPISSSGHLVLVNRWILKASWTSGTGVWLHFVTLMALLTYLKPDLLRLVKGNIGSDDGGPQASWIGYILWSTALTAFAGLTWRSRFLLVFDKPSWVLSGLGIMGVVLWLTRYSKSRRSGLTWMDATLFGLAQSVSILPGISRSGMTIACLLFLGIHFKTAFLFSFFACIPVMAGAFLLEILDGTFKTFPASFFFISFPVTFGSAVGSLIFLRRVLQGGKLHLFGYYSAGLSLLGLAYLHW